MTQKEIIQIEHVVVVDGDRHVKAARRFHMTSDEAAADALEAATDALAHRPDVERAEVRAE